MNTSLLKLARLHFNSDLVPMAINRRNRLAWVRSVRMLGPRWVAIPVLKQQEIAL